MVSFLPSWMKFQLFSFIDEQKMMFSMLVVGGVMSRRDRCVIKTRAVTSVC